MLCLAATGHLYVKYYLGRIFSDAAFKLPKDKHTVYFGDSHAMTSFDPEVIDGSFNASIDSETYFHTLFKMTALLNNNPQIKNVILSYSYHNLSIAENEHFLYGEKYYMLLDPGARELIRTAGNGKYLKYEYEFGDNIFENLWIDIQHSFNSALLWIKYDIGLPVAANKYLNFFITLNQGIPDLNEHPLFPGIYKSNKTNLSSTVMNRTIDEEYFYKHEIGSSDLMIESLNKMVENCHKKNVNMILVNTPLHPKFRNMIPDFYFELHKKCLDNIKTKFNNIHYFDYSFKHYPDSLFGDGDHLNAIGTSVFSNEINDLLKEQFNY